MYKQKVEIIEQVEHYHSQVRELYQSLYGKVEDQNIKIILDELCRQEKLREDYLGKKKGIAKAMNIWLRYSTNKISNYIFECFKNIKVKTNFSLDDVAKLELHFNNCLVKLNEILSTDEKQWEHHKHILLLDEKNKTIGKETVKSC